MSTARKVVLSVLTVIIVGLLVAWSRFYVPLRDAVYIGNGMLAKQICSCVYIANRSVADCRADQFESMDRIQLALDRDAERVRAWVPAFGERTATHREGFGCSIDPPNSPQ
jgi:hypothetical protein